MRALSVLAMLVATTLPRHGAALRLLPAWRSVRTPGGGFRSGQLGGRAASTTAAPALTMSTDASGKQKLVFLGTPEVAAQSLSTLIDAAKAPDAEFEVTAVVTQPATMMGR